MKRKLFLIIILVLAFTSGCVFHKLFSKRAKSILPNFPSVVFDTIKADTVFRDAAGNFHFGFTKPKPVQKNKLPVKMEEYTDSLAEALNIKPTQIIQVESSAIEIKLDSIGFLKKQIDSLKRIVYYFKNKSVNLVVHSGNPEDSSDNGSFDLKINTNLNYVDYYTKKNFFYRTYHQDISSTDSFISISGNRIFSLVKRVPNYGFRAGIKLNYNFGNNYISPGLYFRADANRLSLTGNAFYNIRTNKPSFSGSLGYDFLKF